MPDGSFCSHLDGVSADAAGLAVEGDFAEHAAVLAHHIHQVQHPQPARFHLRTTCPRRLALFSRIDWMCSSILVACMGSSLAKLGMPCSAGPMANAQQAVGAAALPAGKVLGCQRGHEIMSEQNIHLLHHFIWW